MMTILLISAATVISVGAALLDYRTYSSLFRTALILLSGVLIIGYILKSGQTADEGRPVVVITDGVPGADIPQSQNAHIISLESKEVQRAGDVLWLSSVDLLTDIVDSGRVVEIYGNGTREELRSEFQWVDRLTQPSPGLLLERAPQQIDAGKEFQINGRLIAESGADTVTLLRDGEPIQTILSDSSGAFSFRDRLNVEGPAYYQIEAEIGDTLLQEPWHIRATEPDPLSIAIMLYSPSFEMTHLAEWLGNSDHRLAMRTRVGNDRFRFDAINDPPADASELAGNLSSFDLVILDPQEVPEFSNDLVQALKRSVEAGLDVILLPPSGENANEWQEVMELVSGTAVELNTVSRIEERQWTPEFLASNEPAGSVNSRLPIMNYRYEEIGDAAKTPGLFENREPVIVRVPAGRGSVTSHLFYQTYSWKLRGDQGLYAEFWAGYLDRAITIESPFVEIDSQIPMRYNRLILTTSGTALSVRSPGQNQEWGIPLVAGAEHPGVNFGYFWLRSGGWHVAESGEASRWFYVYNSESAWSFNEKHRRFDATRSEIQNLGPRQFDGEASTNQPISARWWLISFLVLQGILWAERKIAG